MESRGANAGRLGVAFLVGLAGALILGVLAKPRAPDNRRFLKDYPAYSSQRFPAAEIGTLRH